MFGDGGRRLRSGREPSSPSPLAAVAGRTTIGFAAMASKLFRQQARSRVRRRCLKKIVTRDHYDNGTINIGGHGLQGSRTHRPRWEPWCESQMESWASRRCIVVNQWGPRVSRRPTCC